MLSLWQKQFGNKSQILTHLEVIVTSQLQTNLEFICYIASFQNFSLYSVKMVWYMLQISRVPCKIVRILGLANFQMVKKDFQAPLIVKIFIFDIFEDLNFYKILQGQKFISFQNQTCKIVKICLIICSINDFGYFNFINTVCPTYNTELINLLKFSTLSVNWVTWMQFASISIRNEPCQTRLEIDLTHKYTIPNKE